MADPQTTEPTDDAVRLLIRTLVRRSCDVTGGNGCRYASCRNDIYGCVNASGEIIIIALVSGFLLAGNVAWAEAVKRVGQKMDDDHCEAERYYGPRWRADKDAAKIVRRLRSAGAFDENNG